MGGQKKNYMNIRYQEEIQEIDDIEDESFYKNE
jgi:hypothetical protein